MCDDNKFTSLLHFDLVHLSPLYTIIFLFYFKNIHDPSFQTSSAAAAAKSLQSYLTLCDPIDGSPPGSPIPGILQARTLEWIAISFSNAWKWKVKVKSLSRVRLLATPWTATYHAPPPMGFSRQEYWSGVPLSTRHLLYLDYLLLFSSFLAMLASGLILMLSSNLFLLLREQ